MRPARPSIARRSCPLPPPRRPPHARAARAAASSAAMKPSKLKRTSGTRQKFTSPLASVAYAAMKPECRPMSLTRPTPFRAPTASLFAARITWRDSIDRGLEAERLLDERDVVVDASWGCRSRRSGARDVQPPRRSPARRGASRPPDDEQDAHAEALERVDHRRRGLGSARGTEHGPSLQVNAVHRGGVSSAGGRPRLPSPS
jgi:hypothetical protein